MRVNLGFWQALLTTAFTVDKFIKAMEHPKIPSIAIPGVLATREVNRAILEELNKSRAEVEKLHQQEMALVKKQEELAKKIARREALKRVIIKITPVFVIGGVTLGIILLARKR
ncbi:MAG: hypothetical protein B6D55_02375 [Candidatus Omnitrophica bacterium 4484_70.2]|nr:MAG: hypothetical protein B6D55_02375 [Candidatus Omnitrophica bacterium 4484_70.2]